MVLRGDEDKSPGQSGLAHMTVKPHGVVVGEHIHPQIKERFLVISGTLGTRLDGVVRELHADEEATATAGTPHDWWNAGEEQASVLVELSGPDQQTARCQAMLATIYGLANDGRTNAKGLPSPLQLALLAREFEDVIRFTRAPQAIQTPLFTALGGLGRMRGLRAVYPEYLRPHGRTNPDREVVRRAGIQRQISK